MRPGKSGGGGSRGYEEAARGGERMSEQGSVETGARDIEIGVEGALAVVTLNRVKALNALTTAMRAELAAALPRFARDPQIYAMLIRSTSPKAFSAGGDVRETIAWARTDPDRARRALADEYRLNWQLECFTKPTVSLIDGMVMGSGVGLTIFGTHRVAGEGYVFAMPETAIGLFPDVGVAHVLARLPGALGVYLGLTGRSIGRADAYALGLATHCIARARFGEIIAGLADAQPIDPLLDERHEEPGEEQLELAQHRDLIANCFSAPTVERIRARLGRVQGAASSFAEGVLADLDKRAPLSLAVTLRHIQDAAARDLRQTLEIDYRLACRFLAGHDFAEGVRAALIDKDNQPKWRPGRIEDVSEAIVDGYFAPLGADELVLPTRQEMQTVR